MGEHREAKAEEEEERLERLEVDRADLKRYILRSRRRTG